MPSTPTDIIHELLSEPEASELLPPTAHGNPRRLKHYVASGRITPAKTLPLLFWRKDVEALRDEILASLEAVLRSARS